MDREIILANLNLKAVLPLLADVVNNDPEAQQITSNWNCKIMMKMMGDGATSLVFKNGACEYIDGSAGLPTFGMWFTSPNTLNRSFNNENVIPLVWITSLKLVNGFKDLTKRLEYYMKPTEEVLSDRKKFAVTVELMIYAAARGAAIIATMDEEASHFAAASPDGTILIKVLPDGPAAYITKKGATITAGKGIPQGGVDAAMEFKDIDTAYGVLSGSLDAMAAIGSMDVKLSGMIPLVDGLNVALAKLGKFFE